MEGVYFVNIKKMAVVAVILLVIFAGQVEGQNNQNTQGDYNMSYEGTNMGNDGGGECGGCHVEASDTISVTWTGDPDTTLDPGEQIDVNFTVDLTTSRVAQDDFFTCTLFNSTVRTTTERPIDPEEDGWTIVKDAVGGTLGYNLVTPYTVENGALGLHYCNWTVDAPSNGGTYELMGMAMWSNADSDVNRNTSVTFTVSGAPEFPSTYPLAVLLPIILPLAVYLLLRKRMPFEMPHSG